MLSVLALAAVVWLPGASPRSAPPRTNVASSRDSVTDARAARKLLDDFKQAWHSADGVKLGNLFTEDGDLVIPTGELVHGRSRVAGFYSSVFARGYRGSSTSAVISQLRHITDNLIIIDATWEITGAMTAKGAPKPPERGILSVTLKRDGDRWLIDALREQTSATRIVPM
jgi:uncharacterized protein (TIGR02246 family)